MGLLAINWSSVAVQVGQLLLALSLLVILHEFGHFITARWFRCRVEKFFLFFDPWFSLVKKKVGDTVYGIGWLPLGGYVKISGMIDEGAVEATSEGMGIQEQTCLAAPHRDAGRNHNECIGSFCHICFCFNDMG